MGNCMNCIGRGQQDDADLLRNSSEQALEIGASQEILSRQLSVPYNELAISYPSASFRESHLQFIDVGVSRSIGIGVGLRSGGGPIISKDEHQVRLAKRIGLIQHLPTKQFDGAKRGECVICMMELISGEEVRYLPCMHTYHAVCIDDWLLRSLTCPTCMEPVDAALINSYHPTN